MRPLRLWGSANFPCCNTVLAESYIFLMNFHVLYNMFEKNDKRPNSQQFCRLQCLSATGSPTVCWHEPQLFCMQALRWKWNRSSKLKQKYHFQLFICMLKAKNWIYLEIVSNCLEFSTYFWSFIRFFEVPHNWSQTHFSRKNHFFEDFSCIFFCSSNYIRCFGKKFRKWLNDILMHFNS